MAYCPIFKGDCPEDDTKCVFWKKPYTIFYSISPSDEIREYPYPGRCGLIK